MLVDRYAKRFLMPHEMDYYTPGDHWATFTINGICCGLLICFDLRFPELYRELVKRGVKVVFQSSFAAGFDGPGIHGQIMPATLQANAANNGLWISAPNSSRHYSRWGSLFIRPDGSVAERLPRNRAGLMVNTVDLAREHYDPVSPARELVMRGQLHNGRCVRDARSRDRQSL